MNRTNSPESTVSNSSQAFTEANASSISGTSNHSIFDASGSVLLLRPEEIADLLAKTKEELISLYFDTKKKGRKI